MDDKHVAYMHAALEEAKKAGAKDEVPIGAVLVNNASGEIIARGHNITRCAHDPTAHAEMNIIRAACKQLGSQRIPGHDLYVTLEPCPMCAAALSFARIDQIIYGAADPKSGGISAEDGPDLYNKTQIHHKPRIIADICADQCGALISEFFKNKRLKNKAPL